MKRFVILAAVAVAAITAGAADVLAQQYTCIIIDGRKCYVYYDDDGNPTETVCDEGSSGKAGFNTTDGSEEIPPEGPLDVQLQPESLTAQIQDEKYGLITTSLDPDRTASNTTIRSVDGKNRYPLSVEIVFPATATTEATGDQVYTSSTELRFVNDNVNSVAPFEKETFKLAEDVEFTDAEGRVVLKLQAGETTVTLGE